MKKNIATKIEFLHKDYVPEGVYCIDPIARKNRVECLKQYHIEKNVLHKILPLITDEPTEEEIIRQDEVQCGTSFWAHRADPSKGEYVSSVGYSSNTKSDKEIMEQLAISTVTPNVVAERILQILEHQPDGMQGIISNKNVTIVGYVEIEEHEERVIYPVVIGYMPQYKKWGIDAQIGVPWCNGLRIISKNQSAVVTG